MKTYCTNSLRTVVLRTTLIVYSPPPLCQVALRLFKDLSIPNPTRALGWATWSAVGEGLSLLHLTLGIIAYSCCVNSCIQTFFRRHMYIIKNKFC